MANGGHPEGKGTNQPPLEEVGEEGKGEEVVGDGESESKSKMESKQPAFGEYKWKWKSAQSQFTSCRIVLTGCHSLNLKLLFL